VSKKTRTFFLKQDVSFIRHSNVHGRRKKKEERRKKKQEKKSGRGYQFYVLVQKEMTFLKCQSGQHFGHA
jgi:hypothetical protein